MKLLTIDGNSIINRAFYGIRQLTAGDGTPTNAIYGFLTILQKLIADETPDALCVTFDLPAPTFRHERYDGYKAHRKPMPDELAVQLPILKSILDAMFIRRFELSGWEADDLLGTLAKRCEAEGWQCVIVTGDKDSLQLVTDHTRVKNVKTRMGQTETIDYTPDVFIKEYGFKPEKMIDLKALMGDSSDNIPGVAGIGEKTALDLVSRIGGLDEIYSDLEGHDIKDTVRKKLEAGRESAELSFELATIRTDAPVEFSLNDCICCEADNNILYDIFKRLGFARLTKEFGLKPPADAVPVAVSAPKIVELKTAEDCSAMLEAAKVAGNVAVQLDAEYFDCIAMMLIGSDRRNSQFTIHNSQLSNNKQDASFTQKEHSEQGEKVFLLRSETTEGFDETLAELLGSSVKKVGHDIKDIKRTCLERGLITDGWIFDTALASYLIEPTDSNYALHRISERYCGFIPDVGGDASGQMTLHADPGKTIAEEAFAIELLFGVLTAKLKELKLDDLFFNIELPLCSILAEMEQTGFLVDKEALKLFSESLTSSIAETETLIFQHSGEQFNINSPKQLGVILFDKLMLPAPKKTKTGYSTNIEVLDSLTGKHPIIAFIKDYRELSKLKSTYADGLLKVIGPDGRIRTHFQMTVTATGRLSSTEPNLQNIPVRKKSGEELRKMFVAGQGNVLVDADYSQIELRLLAHIAADPVMLEAFGRGDDIHAVTASQVFGVPLEEVTSVQRFRAKAVNFGIVYGISAFSLANDIGVTPKEAKEYIESYLANYAGVREYMARIVKNANDLGYVTTLFGRRRFLPELKSSNFNTRSFGERVALNMPIQGTAADIIKIAMLNVARRLKSEQMSARLIMQVHDELIVECPEGEAEAVSQVLREEMENAATLSVPLVAETRTGKSWFEAK